MAGATSLVQLILKKWGDDIAGAAKELEEKVGFPESVANRIATGELPMDEASRLKRAQEQGYGDELYHGSTHDILEFNGRGNPQNDWGEGTYLSDSTHDVSENYAGTHGNDFKSRWFEEKDRLEDDYDAGKRPDLDDGDGSFDHWKAREEAIAKFQGDNHGVIYPVRVRQDGLFSAVSDIDRPDYIEQAREELGLQDIAWSDLTDEAEESLWDMVDELQANDYSHPQFSVNKVTGEYGVTDVPHLDDHETWSSVRDDLLNEYAEDEAGNYVGAGRMVGEMLQDLGAKGVYDPTSVKRHGAMESGEHTIMFPGSENQIRSVNAAFDPQYTGSNIMGGLALPVAAGLLAAGQSEDADAGFITKGGKTLLEAWHGSPHKFDKFSMDQIGTGEGAQAYGHGLYFADSEDVALHYSGGFADKYALDGKPYAYPDDMPVELDPDAYDLAVQNSGRYGKDGAMEKAELMSSNGYSDEWIESYKKYVNEVGDRVGHSKVPKGALYRTEIDVTPESLLDWDKPLSEQPQAVQDSLQFFEFDSNNPSGKEMYHAITNQKRDYQLDRIQSINREMDKMNAIMKADESGYRQFKTDAGRDAARRYDELMAERALLNKETTAQASQSAATSELDAFGIKGIKYLDGDSRAVGDGTSNYVIFDDSLINIAERGNATVPLLGAAALGSAGLLAAPILMGDKEKPTTPEERGFKSWEEVSRDPTAPLPAPTWGEAMGKAGSNLMYLLGMPMTGLQGLARGGYGLLTGEGLTEAAAQAGNTMDVRWKDGLLDVSGMNPDKGADQAEAFVTEKTGDESLGWLAKMGLLFGGI